MKTSQMGLGDVAANKVLKKDVYLFVYTHRIGKP